MCVVKIEPQAAIMMVWTCHSQPGITNDSLLTGGIMSKINDLLSHLGRARKSGKNSWMCKCPSHEDRTASLAIKEESDGTILINCFAGCGALQVLNSIGLDYSILFPEGDELRRPSRMKISINEATRILERESWIIFQYGNSYQQGETPDNTRLLEAVWNVNRVKELLGAN
jgi:hypothetical protein